jgi:hypothetical protein
VLEKFRLEVQDHCRDPGVEEENTLGSNGVHYNSRAALTVESGLGLDRPMTQRQDDSREVGGIVKPKFAEFPDSP